MKIGRQIASQVGILTMRIDVVPLNAADATGEALVNVRAPKSIISLPVMAWGIVDGCAQEHIRS